ncbi:MAG TPA: ABC transporter permease [Methylomusa anaerophila]|nr:ABC transporter permease [Methylomusa anaerophila]HML90115.1 ABC transporter permease [Methylomusa anaerophila]
MSNGLVKALVQIRNFIFGSNLPVILFFVAWEVLPRYGVLDKTIIPTFFSVVEKLYLLAIQGELSKHMAISLQRAAIGLFLAAAVGIAAGFLLGGMFRTLEKLFLPFFRLLEKVNPFAIFPVFILILGIGELSKVSMIYWVCQWPIIFNTIMGIKGVDPLLLKTGRSMGASKQTLFFKVILPAAMPGIFNGLKIGAQLAFIMVIAAEMLGSSSGMGWLTRNAQETYKITQLFGATMLIAIIGLIINKVFRLLEARLLVWRENAFEGNKN